MEELSDHSIFMMGTTATASQSMQIIPIETQTVTQLLLAA